MHRLVEQILCFVTVVKGHFEFYHTNSGAPINSEEISSGSTSGQTIRNRIWMGADCCSHLKLCLLEVTSVLLELEDVVRCAHPAHVRVLPRSYRGQTLMAFLSSVNCAQ